MEGKQRISAVYHRIREWVMYSGDERRPSAPKLWEGDREVYERLVQLRTLLFHKAYSYHDCQPVMAKSYGISDATYYRDVEGLQFIFGDLGKGSRDFEKQRLKELAMKAFQVAAKKEDSKAMSAAVRNLITLDGFDREEPESIDAEKLNPGAYALVVDEESRKLLLSMAAGSGVIDLGLLTSQPLAIDIEHEEIEEIKAEK